VDIPANKLATIFELVHHKKTVGTAQEVGSGLGLFLVRKSVVAQGGCIEIDSTPGQGTVIGFTVAQVPQAQTLA
jgi:signal transduction histidine kinase